MPEAQDTCSVKTTCPYCGVGCGVIATKDTGNNVTIKGDSKHPANLGRLCSKGSALGETVDLDNRLLTPVVDNQQVSWDEALNTVAQRFKTTIEQHGPESVAFYVSGQLLTEDYYVANKLMKGFIGTANIDTNSRLCMSSAVAGHKRAFGTDTVGPCYEDLEQADAIAIIGSNFAWCHPVLYQRIEAARKKNKTRVIVIDPRRTHSCDSADLHLAIKPGTDGILFNGLLSFLMKNDCLDKCFIDQHTEGFEQAIDMAMSSASDIDMVAHRCDLNVKDVTEFYTLFANTEKFISFFSMGINQSSSGVDKVNAIINTHLATGRIGRPGMGAFSITGQPNAMGGREVGGLASTLAAHMDFTDADISRVQRFWNSPLIASKEGLKAVDLFHNVREGKIKALWIMATNPAVSIPNAGAVDEAMKKCDFVVVSDCTRQTDTTRYADVLLPAQAWGEKSGTVTNSERRISRQRSFLPAAGDAMPDWWIICKVAERMGFKDGFGFSSEAAIFREHAALSGFENEGQRDFDISGLADIDDVEYELLPPMQWPINRDNPKGTQRLLQNGRFYTMSGKARFVPVQPRLPVETTGVRFPLVLNTGRVRDQWHTMTRTAKSQRLSRHIREPFVQCHPKTARAHGLVHGQLTHIESKWGSVLVRTDITERQRKGELFIPLHWNDQYSARARVDAVVNPHVDPISGQPEFKHTPVMAKPVLHSWFGFMLSRKEYKLDCTYWTKLREADNWRYEFSDSEAHDLAWFKKHLLNGRDYEWVEFTDEINEVNRYLWFDESGLQGCVFTAAEYEKLPSREWLSTQFTEFELPWKHRVRMLAGENDSNKTDCGEVICSCFNVGKKTILEFIRNSTSANVEEIGEQLRAGTNCGSCRPELKCLIKEA
ncbi:MAG: molybdopterin-dependent oxidoreductase [Gammaproteobacteria bacterium]